MVTPLKDAFRGAFPLGTTLSIAALQGRAPEDVALATTHFNAFTPENSLKPAFVQPREGEFRFDDADRLVEIARRAHGRTIGHTLVWHSQTAPWMFQGDGGRPLERDRALARMRAHIDTVVGRYRGKIREWDVVNEAIEDGPGLLRRSPWREAIGDDYLAEAFHAAHRADRKALLIYNDYNIELPYKRPKALELLRRLRAQKVPVHAVGIQCHWRMDSPDLAEMEAALVAFSDLGLKVCITEMDIGVLPTKYRGADLAAVAGMTPAERAVMDPYVAGLPDSVARSHGERFGQAMAMLLRHREKIARVSLWGSHDGESWLNNFPIRGRTEYALLFDRQRRPKPAYFAVRDAALEAQR